MAVTTSSTLRAYWRSLKRGHPGRRFQARYEQSRRQRNAGRTGLRIALIVAALVCLAIGAVLVVIPGPALPFFFLGGGLLASESRLVARFMDWGELHARAIGGWLRRRWRRLPHWARIALLVLGAAGSLAATWFSYRLLRG